MRGVENICNDLLDASTPQRFNALSMEMITVYRTFSSGDAQLVRSRLEAADLHPTVEHELAALSLEGYAQAAGGILVQVPDDEAEEARALVESKDVAP